MNKQAWMPIQPTFISLQTVLLLILEDVNVLRVCSWVDHMSPSSSDSVGIIPSSKTLLHGVLHTLPRSETNLIKIIPILI